MGKSSKDIDKLLKQPRDKIRELVWGTVRKRYFPELWYTLENWFTHSKTKSILDIGCGNGLLTEALAKSEWQVTAVDPSLDCLMLTQQRFEKSKLTGRFEQATPEALPFPKHSFENIVCCNLLEFSESPRRSMREIYRVLRPGGKAMVVTFARFGPWGFGNVARAVRRDTKDTPAFFLSKSEFVKKIQTTKLNIDRLNGRARYLPGTSGKLAVPFNGAYVAFLTKPEAQDEIAETQVAEMIDNAQKPQ